MRSLLAAMGMVVLALLSACGGGGGSSGTISAEYQIVLTADKTQLPVNVAGATAGIGVDHPYTTVLHVSATVGGTAIPGGDDKFQCNVAAGLNTGALYYLDGKAEHEVEVSDGNGGTVKIPAAYRSITLPANAGGSSFHFHAGNAAGTARITCSVQDPRDQQLKSATVEIVVGASTQLPATVQASAQAPGYLGTRDNLVGRINSVVMQAYVRDDANQPIASASADNVRVRILGIGAAAGARLLAGSQTGDTVTLRTTGGVATFGLASGPTSGYIVLEFTADRRDNDVSNGVQDALTSLYAVTVTDLPAATVALSITSGSSYTVTNFIPFTAVLEATGGVPPYTWSSAGGLPAGLTLSSTGVISGTTNVTPGTYNAVVTVTDAAGTSVSKNIAFVVTGDLPPAPLSIVGCPGSPNVVCVLPNAQRSVSYSYVFTATGGKSGDSTTWTQAGPLPNGLTATQTGDALAITGVPAGAGSCGTWTFVVSVTRGTQSVSQQASITVVSGPGTAVCP